MSIAWDTRADEDEDPLFETLTLDSELVLLLLPIRIAAKISAMRLPANGYSCLNTGTANNRLSKHPLKMLVPVFDGKQYSRLDLG